MKNTLLFILLIISSLLLNSCATSTVNLQVLVPADISVPTNLKKVVIINRSLPEKKEKVINVLEGFVTGETIFADRDGSRYCVKSLTSELNNNPRYEAILKDDEELRGTGTREFPSIINWEKVKEICTQYRADGLIVLETFDSNLGLTTGTELVKKIVDKKEVTVTEYTANLNVNVNSGWRIYDPVNVRIIDQNQFMDEKHWNGRGDTKKAALNSLPSKRTAINESGAYSGLKYAQRISPNWQWINRKYYIRKHASFKVARQYVRKNEWDKATELWTAMTHEKDPKTAGRACYNLALANEMQGHLSEAANWAEKAYKDYNIKSGRSYMNILKTRIRQQAKLNEQLDGVEK